MKHVELEIGERTLPNGLTLLAVRNRAVSTFAAGATLDVDMRDEADGEPGLANLVGDCLDEGTDERTSLELADALDRIGGALEGNISGATVQCPEESSAKAVKILAEVVRRPAFPVREVKRVRAEILQEIKAGQDDPRTVAGQRYLAEVYGSHPYGRPVRGSAEAVAAYKPSDLRRFHRRHFVPTRGYVAAAGPAEVERTLDILQKGFSTMRGDREERAPLPAPELPARTLDAHLPMSREQVHVYLGHPGIRRKHPDYHALSVMDHILGTGPGFTSRISRRLRDEMGLCYSVDASISRSAREEPGCFTVYIGTSAQHRQRAIEGFLEEMQRIRDELVGEQELRDVQEYLTGSYVWRFERNGALARYALTAKHYDLGFDYLHRYPDLVRDVTREDVRRVAREHLHPDRVVIVSAGAG